MMLQGHAGGRFGDIWQVLPAYEQVLRRLEALKIQYPATEPPNQADVPSTLLATFNNSEELSYGATAVATETSDDTTAEHHLSINITIAWQKLDEYYQKLDDNPIYVAAIVLHPRMKWHYLEQRWKERPNWIKASKSAFNSLCLGYQYQEADKATPSPPKRVQRTYDWLSDDDVSDSEAATGIDQQLSEYLRMARSKDMTIEDSPINYWICHRNMWLHLAAMALDIYSTPVMSDEPERVFSITGAALSPRRRLLKSTTIGYAMCVKAWIAAGLIELDRYDQALPSDTTHSLTIPIGVTSQPPVHRLLYSLEYLRAFNSTSGGITTLYWPYRRCMRLLRSRKANHTTTKAAVLAIPQYKAIQDNTKVYTTLSIQHWSLTNQYKTIRTSSFVCIVCWTVWPRPPKSWLTDCWNHWSPWHRGPAMVKLQWKQRSSS